MFDPFRIGYYSQNYKYHRKGSTLRKKLPRNISQYYPTSVSELKKLLPLMYQYKLLSPLNDPTPPRPPSPPSPPPPKPPVEIINKALTDFKILTNDQVQFQTHEDIIIYLNSDITAGNYFYKYRFLPTNAYVRLLHNYWISDNLPVGNYSYRTWLFIAYNSDPSVFENDQRWMLVLPFQLPSDLYTKFEEEAKSESITIDLMFSLIELSEIFPQWHPMVNRYIYEFKPDTAIITYLESIDSSSLTDYNDESIDYYFYWNDYFSDDTSSSSQSIIKDSILGELKPLITIHSLETSEIPLVAFKSNRTTETVHTDITVASPMIIIQPQSELPVL